MCQLITIPTFYNHSKAWNRKIDRIGKSNSGESKVPESSSGKF